MQAHRKIAVAGATGRVGRHVVDVLAAEGHDVVAISRSSGVDVVTGEGLAEALAGVATIIDVATQPSPEQEAATAFFTAAARNLQEVGERAGVERIVVVSIIGIDRFTAGYYAAKVAHERAMLSGPIPVRILRAAQFHEFVPELVEWGRQGEVSYVPSWRTVRDPLGDPPGRRSRRSPVRGKKTSSTWRGCSPPGAATRCESRARAIRPTRTATSTRRAPCCPARTPSSPARRLSSGSTPRPDVRSDGAAPAGRSEHLATDVQNGHRLPKAIGGGSKC